MAKPVATVGIWARDRAGRGSVAAERVEALWVFERACLDSVPGDPASAGLEPAIRQAVTGTVAFGIDAVEDAYERLGSAVEVETVALRRAR